MLNENPPLESADDLVDVVENIIAMSTKGEEKHIEGTVLGIDGRRVTLAEEEQEGTMYFVSARDPMNWGRLEETEEERKKNKDL